MSRIGKTGIVQTLHNGVLYRSRTEARWAVFLDALGADFTYEPETYSLDTVFYLPDFWVASWNLFIEIKGPQPTPYERELCQRLAIKAKRNVLLISGAPGSRDGTLYFRPGEDIAEAVARFAICRRCPGHVLEYEADDGFGALLLGAHGDWLRCGEKIGGPPPRDPIATARNERFGVFPALEKTS